jgi:hypothetical protein
VIYEFQGNLREGKGRYLVLGERPSLSGTRHGREMQVYELSERLSGGVKRYGVRGMQARRRTASLGMATLSTSTSSRR